MRKLSSKLIACMLTAMILFMFCGFADIGSFFIGDVQASVTTDDTSVSVAADADSEESSEEQDVTTVGEVEELRDEYTTVYQNSDGSYTAQLYSSPVRYTDEDGELVDIDTSLKKIEDTSDEETTEVKTRRQI
jgi:hypothetical protein